MRTECIILARSASDAFNTIKGHSRLFSASTYNIILTVATVSLAIGLVYVVYAISTNNPKAKEYGIAWIIALAVYLILLIEEY